MLDINSTISKSYIDYCWSGPSEIKRAKGAYLFSKEGRRFLDCGMALGSVFLGYSNNRINKKAIKALREGVNFSRPSVYERVFYEKISDIFNRDVIGKVSKSSSMLLATIPRICRALTAKKYILTQSEGAFLGNVDWYHSVTDRSLGTAEQFTLTFNHGDIKTLRESFNRYGYDIACVIIELYRIIQYSLNYYLELRLLCDKYHCFLVFDETLSGLRFHKRVFEVEVGISADLTILGKAIANGFALSCVVGKADIFQGIDNMGNLFGFSNTHAGESIALAASLETLKILHHEADYEMFYFINKNFKSNLSNLFIMYNIPLNVSGNDGYFWITGDEEKRQSLIKYCCQNNIVFRGTFAFSLSHTIYHHNLILNCIEGFCRSIKT